MPSGAPAPLVPSDVDLRGMPFMPLLGDRLFKSETWIGASSDAKVAAIQLWFHAFAHEVPAASLPDNDHMLAEYAGLSGRIRTWKKVKTAAMRGWTLCSDGRWYHRVVAELALEAWHGRVRNREKVQKYREKKRAQQSNGADDVTVTDTVTPPLRNHRQSKGQEQLQGQSPPEGSAHAPDVATVIFGQGREWLERQTGKPSRECRALLGRWRRDYGDATLIEALGAAQREGPIDAVAWITKALHERAAQRPRASSLRTTANLAAVLERASESGSNDAPRRHNNIARAAAFAAAFAAGFGTNSNKPEEDEQE